MEVGKQEIIAMLAVLASVVAALWRLNVVNSKKEEQRLKKCEDLHLKSQEQVVLLTGEYRELKGRMDGVEKLSKSVLDKIQQRRE